MRPTRLRTLVGVAVVSAAVGWGVTRLVDVYANRALPVPWSVPLVTFALAVGTALWARSTRARLQRRPGTTPMPPVVAARSAALGLAGSRTGAVVAGAFAGVGLGLAPGWSVDYVRGLVITAGVTVVAGIALVVAALWLERVCRLPEDPSDEPPGATTP